MKDLPKMYHNKINKDISNNKKIFSSLYDKASSALKDTKNIFTSMQKNYTVEQKIYNIFNSPNYIYKVDVAIITDEGKQSKRIIGKTKTNLITFEGEYIPINKIRDIYIAR